MDELASVSRETTDDLTAFMELLLKWNRKINLISQSSIHEIWQRHIQDSLQLKGLLEDKRDVLDIGSGGGFPGIVLAIAAKHDPDNRLFTLVESDMRKATFLREAVRMLKLNAEVLDERIEAIERKRYDAITARAFAPLNKILELSQDLLATDGVLILPKGRTFQTELDEARILWNFDLDIRKSETAEEARILILRNLEHV